jgi:DNA-binding CsgD family transcriptional regulator
MKLSREHLETLRKIYRLAPREVQVLDCLYEGLATNQEIADRLKTTEAAIRAATRTLYLKVSARSKHETVLRCLETLGLTLGDAEQGIYAE